MRKIIVCCFADKLKAPKRLVMPDHFERLLVMVLLTILVTSAKW